jgi:uncharacterized protein DUF3188
MAGGNAHNPSPHGHPVKKTIGTWRVLPLPEELRYASPDATPARTHSGFGIASIVLGCAVALAVPIAVCALAQLSSKDGDHIAVAAMPVCLVGAGLGVTGSVRRSQRRLPGLLGILINAAVALGVAVLWLVAHAPA